MSYYRDSRASGIESRIDSALENRGRNRPGQSLPRVRHDPLCGDIRAGCGKSCGSWRSYCKPSLVWSTKSDNTGLIMVLMPESSTPQAPLEEEHHKNRTVAPFESIPRYVRYFRLLGALAINTFALSIRSSILTCLTPYTQRIRADAFPIYPPSKRPIFSDFFAPTDLSRFGPAIRNTAIHCSNPL